MPHITYQYINFAIGRMSHWSDVVAIGRMSAATVVIGQMSAATVAIGWML